MTMVGLEISPVKTHIEKRKYLELEWEREKEIEKTVKDRQTVSQTDIDVNTIEM